jgi:hypothetical protein
MSSMRLNTREWTIYVAHFASYIVIALALLQNEFLKEFSDVTKVAIMHTKIQQKWG